MEFIPLAIFYMIWCFPCHFTYVVFHKDLKRFGGYHDGIFQTLALLTIFAPLVPFFARSEYKKSWVRDNITNVKEYLDPWGVKVRLNDHRDTFDVEIEWKRTPENRIHWAEIRPYKDLRALEKMPTADWVLKYLPYTKEYANKFASSRIKFTPYRG